jgi:glyceraldehyde 3-phosphate dehydrogenase
VIRVGINGFGRMGRLALRAARGSPEFGFTHINEIHGDAAVAAHLLMFDSVHGRWGREATADADGLVIDGRRVSFSRSPTPGDISWADLGIDVLLESSGVFRTMDAIEPYFAAGVRKVVVAAPVKDERALNVVVGVNDGRYDPRVHDVVTAASCTTNCLAPVVQVIHEALGIERGAITTLHDMTNTQTVVDAPHTDPRRARAAGPSLKILARYDNEWGYVNRLVELVGQVATTLPAA